MSYTNFLGQIQVFLLFRIVLNKGGAEGLNPNAFNDNPIAFNDPVAFKNLLRLMTQLRLTISLMRLMIRKGRPTSLG